MFLAFAIEEQFKEKYNKSFLISQEIVQEKVEGEGRFGKSLFYPCDKAMMKDNKTELKKKPTLYF